jgi:hypothetical protein
VAVPDPVRYFGACAVGKAVIQRREEKKKIVLLVVFGVFHE